MTKIELYLLEVATGLFYHRQAPENSNPLTVEIEFPRLKL
jgi:hypothetical protein